VFCYAGVGVVRSSYYQEDNSTRAIACNSGIVTGACAISRASARLQTLRSVLDIS
jgi:hypothetical protein